MNETAPVVEVRLSCRVGGRGLATLRRHPDRPHLVRVAVGSEVRFTLAADDLPAVRDAVQHARMSGQAVATLTGGEGFYLTKSHRVWHRDEDVFRLSIGSPLRRWLWSSELSALAAVLAHAATHPALLDTAPATAAAEGKDTPCP